jgi:hypothetical protein
VCFSEILIRSDNEVVAGNKRAFVDILFSFCLKKRYPLIELRMAWVPGQAIDHPAFFCILTPMISLRICQRLY